MEIDNKDLETSIEEADNASSSDTEKASASDPENAPAESSENMSAVRTKKIYTIAKFAVLLILVIGIPLYIFLFHRDVFTVFKSVDTIQAFFEAHKSASVFIYLGGQILQVVVAAIPGQAFQLAAGYFFGFLPGLLWSIIGVILGTVITFFLARLLGRDAMYLIFGEKKLQSFIDKLNSKRAYLLVFIIYLIPGIPKDLFNYAAGVSEINFKAFLILSTIGRIPGMMGSLAIGLMVKNGSYTALIIIGVIVAVILVLAFIFRHRLKDLLDMFYEKMRN
ncbi:MAG: TVP38/TMEM64 family protein [Firmicutes bacterium]|nr:TVP38/TMEM64 family protein [Bacillota bacterium]